MISRRFSLWLVIFALLPAAAIAQVTSQVIQSQEIEDFLRQAKIVSAKNIGEGVTLPLKLTMQLNGVTRYGVFKSIDVQKPFE